VHYVWRWSKKNGNAGLVEDGGLFGAKTASSRRDVVDDIVVESLDQIGCEFLRWPG